MDKSEEEYLLELWERNICPQCGSEIPGGKKFGTGKKREGGFCSLECYTLYHQTEIIKRQQRILRLRDRHTRG